MVMSRETTNHEGRVFGFGDQLFAAMSALGQSASGNWRRYRHQRSRRSISLALKQLIKPNGKPRLINFWATWCGPCREEYPDLVKIDEQYRGKDRFSNCLARRRSGQGHGGPKFLSEMKAEMPTYLLVTNDDDEAAMAVVSKSWNGSLPFTILFDPNGGVAVRPAGKVRIRTAKSGGWEICGSSEPIGEK